jgi:hypothetical protein
MEEFAYVPLQPYTKERTPRGKLISGRYLPRGHLAQGQFSKIKLVEDTLEGRLLVVKKYSVGLLRKKVTPVKLKDGSIRHKTPVDDVHRELQALSRLDSRHCLRLYGVLATEGKLYLLTSHCAGGSVLTWDAKGRRFGGRERLGPGQLRRVMRGCLGGLLHRGVLTSQAAGHRAPGHQAPEHPAGRGGGGGSGRLRLRGGAGPALSAARLQRHLPLHVPGMPGLPRLGRLRGVRGRPMEHGRGVLLPDNRTAALLQRQHRGPHRVHLRAGPRLRGLGRGPARTGPAHAREGLAETGQCGGLPAAPLLPGVTQQMGPAFVIFRFTV